MGYRVFAVVVALFVFLGLVQAQREAVPANRDASNEPASADEQPQHDRGIDTLALEETRPCLFTPKIPVEYITEQRHKQLAASRLSVDLDRGTGILELEYEGESTQTPVIAAFFNEDESEDYLDAATYRERADRSALVAFTVKSTPRNFGPYTTILEHTHINEAGEVTIKSIPFPNLETFEEQKVTVSGLLPGVNRLKLRIKYTNNNEVTTTSEGVSHFVRVDEVPALDLETFTEVDAHRRDVNGLTTYRSKTSTRHTFMLSPAVDAKSIKVRVMRKGARSVNLEGVDPGLRAIVGQAPTNRSSELIHQFELGEAEAEGVTIESLGSRRYAITIEHALAVSENLLPVADEWEYTVELRHVDHAKAIDRFSHVVGAKLNADEQIVTYRNGDENESEEHQTFDES